MTDALYISLNNAYTNGKGHGRRVLTAEGRNYKAGVVDQVLKTSSLGWAEGRLSLTMRLYFPNRQRRDITNCIKLLEDALAEALKFDDCTVDRVFVERAGVDKVNPRCEVQLEVLSAAV
jgi:Holliday junction resolvase RusA-like endonuclease